MRRAAFVAPVLAWLGACGPVDGGAVLQAPFNACDQSACSSYAQPGIAPACIAGNVCQAKNKIDPLFYVITPATNAFFAPSQTFVLSNSDLLANKCVRATQLTSCVRLPAVGEIAGSYVADNDIATKFQYYLGGGPGAPIPNRHRSVPVQATFRPAAPLAPGVSLEGGLLGVDLEPIFARPTLDDQTAFPAPAPAGAEPASVPNVGFDTTIPVGAFEETLTPLPPFDAAFPPVVQTVSIAAGGTLNHRDPNVFENTFLGTRPQGATGGVLYAQSGVHPVTVTRAGGFSIEGWTLFLRDDRTSRRISSIPKLHEPAVINLYTINQNAPNGGTDTIRDNVELVLHPSDPTLPDLVLAAIANNVPNQAAYPLVPPIVTVRGQVAADDGTPVRADIALESEELSALDNPAAGKDLRYTDQVTTTSQGTFERSLPAGKYSAIVTPVASSGYAKTIVDLVVDVPSKPGEVVQEGKVLIVQHPVLLRGTCVATDGRVVADADIEAHASASLRYAVNPAERDPLKWPRTVHTSTNAAGQFVLPVDPNATYDIVARPATGTRFPWTTLEKVGTSTTDLRPIKVPVPTIVDLTLHDPNDVSVPHALVRAFVSVAAPSPGAPPVALEIGRAETDDSGRFQLYLDGTRQN